MKVQAAVVDVERITKMTIHKNSEKNILDRIFIYIYKKLFKEYNIF